MDTITNLCNEIAEKIPQVYSKGKQDERNAFWDEALKNTSAIGRFAGRSWTKNNFKPTGDIIINNSCNFCFYNSGIGVDLIALAEELGITIDIKPISYALNMFQYSNIKGARVDFTELVAIGNAFTDASHMERIVLKLKEDGTNTFSSTFSGCTKLKILTIESGVIGQDINFSQSPLTPESMISIITHLFDFGFDEHVDDRYTKTIKFSNDCWNALNEYSKPPDFGNPDGDWKDYVSYLGWNT